MDSLRDAFRRLMLHRMTFFGFIIVVANVLLAIAAPFVSPNDPLEINLQNKVLPPSSGHYFGTDEYGRDIFSRVLHGASISLQISATSVILSLLIGIPLGGLSGFYGGFIDLIFMRMVDAIMSFPAILLAIGIMAALGPNKANLTIALGVVFIPRIARVIRGSVLSLKEKDFVEASRAIGNSEYRTFYRHVLPNCLSPIIVQSTMLFAYATLAEAALSFLGLGTPPPAPSWGNILSDGRNFMSDGPWMTIFPGLAIALAVFGYNLFGDGLRDLLDPRLKE